MLNSSDIREAVFATSMSGYKKDEVDAFLDKILEDYQQFETVLAEQQAKLSAMEKELADKEVSMNSINSVLISAQKLADDIVANAKKQAEDLVEAANTESENIKLRTKKALEEIDAVLTQQKNDAQAQVDKMLEDAARKSEGMILAAKDSVTREQLLFDKLKSEVAEFKKQIKDTYKEHLESLSKLPEEVVLSPELAASTIEDIINNEPNLLSFIEKTDVELEQTEVAEEAEVVLEPEVIETIEEELEAVQEAVFEAEVTLEDIKEEEEPQETVASTGFVIQAVEEDDNNEDDDTPTFSKGFFAKHK